MKNDKNKWVLLDSSFSTITGNEITEKEAEKLRKDNSAQYLCVTLKRKATDMEAMGYKLSSCWNHPGFNNRHKYWCACSDCKNDVFNGQL